MTDVIENLEKRANEATSKAEEDLYNTLMTHEALYTYKIACEVLEEARKQGEQIPNSL